ARDQAPVLRVVAVVAAGPERADVEAFDHPKQAVQVIGVGMRQRDDVDPADATRAQERLDDAGARIERPVSHPAAVDHHDARAARGSVPSGAQMAAAAAPASPTGTTASSTIGTSARFPSGDSGATSPK